MDMGIKIRIGFINLPRLNSVSILISLASSPFSEIIQEVTDTYSVTKLGT